MKSIGTKNTKQYVVRTKGFKYMCIDPHSGYPGFDDELCDRTTRRSKEDLKQYIENINWPEPLIIEGVDE